MSQNEIYKYSDQNYDFKKVRGSLRLQSSGNAGVMEDAMGTQNGLLRSSIQETGQEKRPARMVGYSSLDSARPSKEAGCDEGGCDAGLLRWRGGANDSTG